MLYTPQQIDTEQSGTRDPSLKPSMCLRVESKNATRAGFCNNLYTYNVISLSKDKSVEGKIRQMGEHV